MRNECLDFYNELRKILTNFLQILQNCIAVACIVITIVAKVLHCTKLSYILQFCKLQCNFAKLLRNLTICKQVCKFVNFLQAELAKGRHSKVAEIGGAFLLRGLYFYWGGSLNFSQASEASKGDPKNAYED